MAPAVRGDHVLQVVVMGESGVGKSCLVSVFADEVYVEDRAPTVAVDIRTVSMSVGEKRVKCLVWDTAGKSGFEVWAVVLQRRAARHVVLTSQITTRLRSYKVGAGAGAQPRHARRGGHRPRRNKGGQAGEPGGLGRRRRPSFEKGCLCYCETSAHRQGVKDLPVRGPQ